MIGRLNHVAIAVPDLVAAARLYGEVLGAEVSAPVDLAEHGVTTVFVMLANTRIELIHPLGPDSPITGFLAKNPRGGMHHLCFEVDDIAVASERARKAGLTILGSGGPREGAHGKPVIFLSPRDLCGTLVEFEEA